MNDLRYLMVVGGLITLFVISTTLLCIRIEQCKKLKKELETLKRKNAKTKQ